MKSFNSPTTTHRPAKQHIPLPHRHEPPPSGTNPQILIARKHMHTPKMWLSSVLLSCLAVASALKFDLPAQQKKHLKPRCIRNYVGKDTLVVVTATLSGTKGDGQTVNIYVGLLHYLPTGSASCEVDWTGGIGLDWIGLDWTGLDWVDWIETDHPERAARGRSKIPSGTSTERPRMRSARRLWRLLATPRPRSMSALRTRSPMVLAPDRLARVCAC